MFQSEEGNYVLAVLWAALGLVDTDPSAFVSFGFLLFFKEGPGSVGEKE